MRSQLSTKLFENVHSNFQEAKMKKTLIFGLALAFVLVSGGFFSAQADCGFGGLSHISWPKLFCCGGTVNKDVDRAESTCFGGLPNISWPKLFCCGGTANKDVDRPEATCTGGLPHINWPKLFCCGGTAS